MASATAWEPSPSPMLPNPGAPVGFPSPTGAESAPGPPAESQAAGLSWPFSGHHGGFRSSACQNFIFKGFSVKQRRLVCSCKLELSRQREGRKGERNQALTSHSSQGESQMKNRKQNPEASRKQLGIFPSPQFTSMIQAPAHL